MSAVIKALRLTKMENDILDIQGQIRKDEWIINSREVGHFYKKECKKRLLALELKRRKLVDDITEMSLLGE